MKIKALVKIINLHFWKSIFGPFFAFGFPIIFVGILGSLLGFDVMFGGLLLISSTAVALTSMPQAIFEFKKSALLKRIGVTPIKPWMFIAIAGAFYALVMVVGTLFTMVMGIAIFSKYMDVGREVTDKLTSFTLSNMLAHIQWGGVIYALLLNIVVGTSLGLMIVSLTKSTIAIQGVGIPILIISQFLTAQVLPLYMVHGNDSVADPMWYLGYISPFKSTTALMLQSWNPLLVDDIPKPPVGPQVQTFLETFAAAGSKPHQLTISGGFNVFDINAQYKVLDGDGKMISIFTKPERILNLILPFVWTIIFSVVTIKKFKWSTR